MRRPASAPESASASPELNLQTCGWTKSGGTPVKGKGKPQSQETGQKTQLERMETAVSGRTGNLS